MKYTKGQSSKQRINAMSDTIVKMQLVKSTKGTHVYGDSSPDAPIQSVYIKRAALPATPPANLSITISYEAG